MFRRTFSLLLVWLCLTITVSGKSWPDGKGFRSGQLVRRDSDPCCKSCALIAQNIAECPVATSDVFCGCDIWVKGAPSCEACLFDVGFNSTFATYEGFLEFFWVWCRCPYACRGVAEALVSPSPCGGGTNMTCVSEYLAKEGPECLCCMEKLDAWFSSFFAVWIGEANDFLAGKMDHPGYLIPSNLANKEQC
jgi:hypothetical protein